MNEECQRFKKQLSEILDEQWVPSGETPVISEEIRAHAAMCPSCREMLRVTEGIIEPDGIVPVPPPDLADRVFHNVITADQTDRKKRSVIRWTGMAAAAAALVLSTFFATAAYYDRVIGNQTIAATVADEGDEIDTTPIKTPASEEGEPIVVELRLQAPWADTVVVVGDWNEWDPDAHPLHDADGDGVWEVEIEVRPDNEYRYQFVIDGRTWIPDPSSPITVDDGFGGENSVLNI